MAGAERDAATNLEPARKRQRLSFSQPTTSSTSSSETNNNLPDQPATAAVTMAQNTMGYQADKEASVGILRFVNEVDQGFSGILKQRYTDFLVNEVSLDGEVIHLTTTRLPKREPQKQTWDRPEGLSENKEALGINNDVATPVAVPITTTEVPKSEETLNASEVSAQSLQDTTRLVVAETQPVVQKEVVISEEDTSLLDSYFGQEMRETVVRLDAMIRNKPDAKPSFFGQLFTQPMKDRQLRGQMHHNMRRIFDSRMETAADEDGVIKIVCAARRKPQGRVQGNNPSNGAGRAPRINQPKGKLGWQELGGEHLHFSLYKENKDTMEVVSFLGSRTRIQARNFCFAGTKDRRAVTVQRISVYRTKAEDLVKYNRELRNAQIGDFKYEKYKLELGDLAGNQFIITLRDCKFDAPEALPQSELNEYAAKVVGDAVASIQKHGFINYFGLQRFGSHHIGTDVVGRKILQGDFEGAVKAILYYTPEALEAGRRDGHNNQSTLPRDDIARAHGIWLFETTGKSNQALEKLPRKFSGESSIIRHLGRNKTDFPGALLQITRNLRLMYVHAYQSLVWNLASSERLARFGNKVISGDLVIIDKDKSDATKEADVDENGELIVRPAEDDFAMSANDLFERARALTEEEASSGKYTMFDIVLPLPGFDVEYPANEIGDFYKEFMSSERGGNLDPANMRRAHKDFSLSGSYRKVLAKVGPDASFEIKTYTDDHEQMVETDLERCMKANPAIFNRDNHRTGDRNQGHQNNDGGRGGRGRRSGHYEDRVHDAQRQETLRAGWQNLPGELEAEDKKNAADAAERKAAEEADPSIKQTPSAPTLNVKYIETDPQEGHRTGRVESTVTNGTDTASTTSQVGGREQRNAHASSESNSSSSNDGGATLERPDTKGTKREADEAINDLRSTEAPETGVPEDKVMADEPEAKIAVVVKFQLGSSQYATMALRELMKQGGVKTYKPDYNSR